MDNCITIKGHVEQYLDGELISSSSNQIYPDLKDTLNSALFSQINIGLGNNDDASLFSNQNIQNTSGNIEGGNDGIVLRDENASNQAPYFTMQTTEENLTYNTYGVQWRGVQTASSERDVSELLIGHSYLTGDSAEDTFFTTFAIRTFVDIIVSEGQTYEVFWGIYFG